MLHYVIRTRECVLLDDASADETYSKDEYVRRRRSRSLLCLPIIKQSTLVGALYLEKPEEVDQYNLAFNHLVAAAVSPVQSLDLIRATAKQFS